MKNILYITAILMLFVSCEDVIDIELNYATPRLVIEGNITNASGPYSIKISRTTDYFNPSENASVSKAIVSITDSKGNSETLIETIPGVYETTTIQGVIGRTYNLSVNIDGEIYEASSTMPDTTSIDFIAYDKATLFQGEPDDYYFLTFFQDTENVVNFYKLKFISNSKPATNVYLTNDEWQDGKAITFGILAEKAALNDTIVIELENIDKSVYDYYTTLNSLLEDMFIFSTSPANPISNISNGALGYFSAYSHLQESVIIR